MLLAPRHHSLASKVVLCAFYFENNSKCRSSSAQGLSKLLADNAPECIREQKFENYFGRKIAVDASMHIYSFLVVVGRTGDQLLTSETGEVTSHLLGMFFRTTRMLEAGMKPVFVFEGRAPDLKREELAKRSARREGATADLETAKAEGNQADVEKYSKRTVRVTREHNEECKRLLTLMGVPVIVAPSEAEAQCAQLCKDGHVYAISTEDMDSLTFATPKLVRHLMAPVSQKVAIAEFDHSKVLEGLGLTRDEFIDMCILCGCDYTDKIGGIGPVRALQLIQKHRSIEKVLENLDPEKYKIPDPFPYQEARRLFKEPDVLTGEAVPPLKWSSPNIDGLIKFLVDEKNFDEKRVRTAVDRINSAKSKSSQGRLESFFGPAKTVTSGTGMKRKEEASKGKKGPANKRGKLGGVGSKK